MVSVEAAIHDGMPGFHMTGYLSQETREAQERVRTALRNAGFRLPAKKVVVNLSPADVRKEGTAYDLAVAAAVLGALGQLPSDAFRDAMVIGELGLDGRVKGVRGVLSLTAAARQRGLKRCFLPRENAAEGEIEGGIQIIPAESIQQLAEICKNQRKLDTLGFSREDEALWKKTMEEKEDAEVNYDVDFSEVNGQPLLRRATEIAVAGRHNILYIGPAGSGKTMAAKRIPTIMPPLSREESVKISKIYSICGLLPPQSPLIRSRPFRNPHHTITPGALAGGGAYPKPGEISLASGGVLFLDELPEFSGKAIEILRQPLEEKEVRISRLHQVCTFPADTVLAAACNPCPCGFYPGPRCTCSPWQIKRYIGRISRPILDRIDITVEASPVSYEEFRGEHENESSARIRERVIRVKEIQEKRFLSSPKIRYNGEMGVKEIRQYCRLDQKGESYLQEIYQKLQLSARGCHKILKVARTIADLEGKREIDRIHLWEAAGYRSLEEKYWRG